MSLKRRQGFIQKYIFSTDHKVIGIQYFFLALTSVVVGMLLSVLMRFHLLWPAAKLPFLQGGVMTPAQYLSLVTMHGTMMVFFVLTTAPQAGFGNYFLPIQIGAPDMAFPPPEYAVVLGHLPCILELDGGFLGSDGAPISGWTAYTPLSGLGQATGPGEGWGQTMWIVSISLFCLASLLGALNFIATLIDMRAPGMSLMRMPLTCWSWFVTAILTLLAFGVLLAGGILLFLDRTAGTSFFLPSGLVLTDQLQSHSGVLRSCGSTSSGFLATLRFILRFFPAWELRHTCSPRSSRKPIFGYKRWSRDLCHRFSGFSRSGPSHVRQRDEPILQPYIFRSDDVNRGSVRD